MDGLAEAKSSSQEVVRFSWGLDVLRYRFSVCLWVLCLGSEVGITKVLQRDLGLGLCTEGLDEDRLAAQRHRRLGL